MYVCTYVCMCVCMSECMYAAEPGVKRPVAVRKRWLGQPSWSARLGTDTMQRVWRASEHDLPLPAHCATFTAHGATSAALENIGFLNRRANMTTTTPSLSLSFSIMDVRMYLCMYVCGCLFAHIHACMNVRNPEPYVCAWKHVRIHGCTYCAWRVDRKKIVPSTNIILSADQRIK